MDRNALIGALDELLEIPEFPDFSGAKNGVQLTPPAEITTIATAVDGCLTTAKQAVAAGAQLLLVHHGILWGPNEPIVGARHGLLEALLCGPCGLYSAHLPLDAHPRFGNNAILARRLGMAETEPFGSFGERPIGVIGPAPVVSAEEAGGALGIDVIEAVPAFGTARRLAIVSGSAGSMIDEALAAGADVLLTGELGHHGRVVARDKGLGIWLGGHYGTETFGVRALGEYLAETYALEHVFLDAPTGI